MDIKLWDNYNKQWLEPISIFFGKDNTIWKVTACEPGGDPLSEGWYDIEGDKLKHIALTGNVNFNTEIIPEEEKGEQVSRPIGHGELGLILTRFKIMMEEEPDRFTVEEFIEQENFRRNLF